MEINEDFIQTLKQWAEGNEYLFSLLYLCWEKNIKTYACCAGHEEKNTPYIGIILNETSFKYVESILAALEGVDNVVISTDYRHHSNLDFKDGLNDNERKVLTISCKLHNRCEVFFKLACAVDGLPKKVQSERSKLFLQHITNFIEQNDDILKSYLQDKITIGKSISTITEDFKRFEEYKKKEALYANGLLQFFSKKIKNEHQIYKNKYPTQIEYREIYHR